ncbi:MAG TPA: glycosyltransferase family 2 protein [Candidatus Saccharimonadales bacterium]|nr:glycosyltransferase family 2 protein [Candidatus Saccharimonadales bacterium]
MSATVAGEYARANSNARRTRPSKYKRLSKSAILIASKDGEKTIYQTVRAARATRYPVYVVSDGSSDRTAQEARRAGARVLALRKNVGKPAALHRAYKHFKLGQEFSAIAILDDDVVIEKDFMRESKKLMSRDTAIVVGKNQTAWPKGNWNAFLAVRAYSYWNYQLILRRIQSAYNVMNCISGSNSLYRTEVLDKVLRKHTPYIVDDTFWTLETHRLGLGNITYAPAAKAWIQDPTNLQDWYKQNLRWMWGTFQGIIGHRLGTQLNKFQLAYTALMLEWAVYIASGPLVIYLIARGGLHRLPVNLLLLCSGYMIWVLAAAFRLKRPALVLFLPAIVILDFVFRALMVHALVKAIRHQTVESCTWNSPKRLDASLLVHTI